MEQEVQSAFEEMLDISTDIDRAVLFGPGGVLASNMSVEGQASAVEKAMDLARLGDARAAEMGSQAFSQLVIETPVGYVFLAREVAADGLTIMATGKKNSRIGLVLYDLKTCLRDIHEGEGAAGRPDETEEE